MNTLRQITKSKFHEKPIEKPYKIEVIFVHDVYNQTELLERLEGIIATACEKENEEDGNAAETTFHIRNYRLSRSSIRDKAKLTAYVSGLGKHISSSSRKQTEYHPRNWLQSASQQSEPKILFIAYELGAWIVREFLATVAGLMDRPPDSADVIGIIFLGAEAHDPFEYVSYLKNQFLRGTDANSATPTTTTGTSSPAASNPAVRDPLERLERRLSYLDRLFLEVLSIPPFEHLASSTWILPAPSLHLEAQVNTYLNTCEILCGGDITSPFEREELTAVTVQPAASITQTASGLPMAQDQKKEAKPRNWLPKLGPQQSGASGSRNQSEKRKSKNLGTGAENGDTALRSKLRLVKCLAFEDSQDYPAPDPSEMTKDLFTRRCTSLGRCTPRHFQTTGLASPDTHGSSSLSDLGYTESPRKNSPPKQGGEEKSEEDIVSRLQKVPHEDTPEEDFDSPRSPTPRASGSWREPAPDFTSHPAGYTEPPSHLRGFSLAHRDTPRPLSAGTLEKIENLANEARFSLRKGDFNQAERYYEYCLSLFHPSKVPFELYTSIAIQKATVQIQSGRYKDAQRELEGLREEPNLINLPVRRDQITYHLGRVMLRRGENKQAKNLLEPLKDGVEFRKMTYYLEGSPLLEPELKMLLPEMEVVIGRSRLLALLDGYYGRFEEARKHLDDASRRCRTIISLSPHEVRSVLGHDLLDMEVQIELAIVEISMLRRRDRRGWGPNLNRARSTLGYIEWRFGVQNILTLQANVFHAMILAHMFDEQATAICTSTIRKLSEYVGPEHPLTFEVLSTLADILVGQDRPFEAQDTILALVKQASRRLGDDNPQTIKYRCQLGDIICSIGNYLESKIGMQATFDTAESKWGDEHPSVLRCLTKLAIANQAMAKLDMASEHIERALRKQVVVLREKDAEEERTVDVADLLDGWLSGSGDGNFPEPDSIITPHPDVLLSLEVYAEICAKRQLDQFNHVSLQTLKIIGLVYEKRRECFGETHPVTLRSGVRLGYMYLEGQNEGENTNRRSFYRKLYQQCDTVLGPNHTLTWLSKMAITLSSDFEDYPTRVRADFAATVKGLNAHLGATHPITLEWMLRLFMIQQILTDEGADDTAARLLGQLRQRKMREQRLIVSLELEWKVGLLYCSREDYERGLPIFDSLEKSFKSLKRSAQRLDVVNEFSDFQERFEDSVEPFRGRAKILLSQRRNNAKQGKIYEREAHIRRAIALAKALYGDEGFETAQTRFTFVKMLENTEDVQKSAERLKILSDLVDLVEIERAERHHHRIPGPSEASQEWPPLYDEILAYGKEYLPLSEKTGSSDAHDEETVHDGTLYD